MTKRWRTTSHHCRCAYRHSELPPSCVQSLRKTQDTGAGSREDPGQGLLRSWSNAMLRDMNLAVEANDDRAIEVLASGLPLFFGALLAVDITVCCAFAAEGTAQPGAARVDGAVCTRAREDKEPTYSELLSGDRCWSLSLSKREEDSFPVCGKLGRSERPRRSTRSVPFCYSGVETTVAAPDCRLGRSIVCQLSLRRCTLLIWPTCWNSGEHFRQVSETVFLDIAWKKPLLSSRRPSSSPSPKAEVEVGSLLPPKQEKVDCPTPAKMKSRTPILSRPKSKSNLSSARPKRSYCGSLPKAHLSRASHIFSHRCHVVSMLEIETGHQHHVGSHHVSSHFVTQKPLLPSHFLLLVVLLNFSLSLLWRTELLSRSKLSDTRTA